MNFEVCHVDKNIFVFQTSLPRLFKESDNLDKIDDYKSLLTRLKKIPLQLDQVKTLLNLGIEKGITLHNASLHQARKQFEVLETIVEDSDFYYQFKLMPQNVKLNENSNQVIQIQNEAKARIKVVT